MQKYQDTVEYFHIFTMLGLFSKAVALCSDFIGAFKRYLVPVGECVFLVILAKAGIHR
jgi:hypothetical protein